MENFCKTEINWKVFGTVYLRRYFTSRFIRFYIKRWYLIFTVGWNPYKDSRMLYIFIGLPQETYLAWKFNRLIKRNPRKLLRILQTYKQIESNDKQWG